MCNTHSVPKNRTISNLLIVVAWFAHATTPPKLCPAQRAMLDYPCDGVHVWPFQPDEKWNKPMKM
jgi:hypothetical protein